VWFEAHRGEYESAVDFFASFVGRLIAEIGKVQELGGITPRDCIMRIYRDVRFSKDKSPYRTELGAGIIPGGKRSGRLGYHVSLAPNGKTMVAGGLYDPTPRQLSLFRDAICQNAAPFKGILISPSFKKHFGSLWGESLKTAPKGYERDHPEIELLRRTQVCAVENFSQAAVLSARFERQVVDSVIAMKPFIDYLDSLVS
jgi:uncharacterized protein (TIGR02453 family)